MDKATLSSALKPYEGKTVWVETACPVKWLEKPGNNTTKEGELLPAGNIRYGSAKTEEKKKVLKVDRGLDAVWFSDPNNKTTPPRLTGAYGTENGHVSAVGSVRELKIGGVGTSDLKPWHLAYWAPILFKHEPGKLLYGNPDAAQNMENYAKASDRFNVEFVRSSQA